jgi:hypothetical protein
MSQTESDSWDLTDEEYEQMQSENPFQKPDNDNSGIKGCLLIALVIVILMVIFRLLGIDGDIPMKPD